MATINITTDAQGNLIAVPPAAVARRGDVVTWTTDVQAGVTIVPLKRGLTMLKRTAYPQSPAQALATNIDYYEYDVYSPALDDPNGNPIVGAKGLRRIVAVLIVSEYLAGQGGALRA